MLSKKKHSERDSPNIRVESSFDKYQKELRETPPSGQYQVYEQYGPSALSANLKDQKDYSYWSIAGEAITKVAQASFYESRETLLGKKGDNSCCRDKFFVSLLTKGQRKDIAGKLPKKCPKCGFHRFWEINVVILSATQSVWVTCPNCRKKIIRSEDLEWSDT